MFKVTDYAALKLCVRAAIESKFKNPFKILILQKKSIRGFLNALFILMLSTTYNGSLIYPLFMYHKSLVKLKRFNDEIYYL